MLLASILVISAVMLAVYLSWNPVFTVGLIASIIAVGYLIIKPSHASAFHLMILTLPFLAAFVIDIGGNLRVPYYFALIALFLALYQGQLFIPRKSPAIWLLIAFVAYAFLSTALTMGFEYPAEVESFGFRTSQFRPLIQAGQLTLMITFFYLTFNYLSSGARLQLVSKLIFWSLVLVVTYGTYEVICALFDFSFFNINTNPDDLHNRYAGTHPYASGGIWMLRPRSILLEPLNLGIYILFSFPFAFARLCYIRTGVARWLTLVVLALALLLFAMTWSRGAFIGMLVALPLALVLVPSLRFRLLILLGGVFGYLAMGLIIFPMLGGNASITSPATKIYERLHTVTSLPSAIRADSEAVELIGRSYYYPVAIFRKNPILGVGLGNYPIAFAELTETPLAASAPFSLHLELLTQLGIIGSSFFYFLVGCILYRLFRTVRYHKRHTLRPLAVASIVSIVGFMTASAALGGLTTSSHLWVMLAIGLAIPYLMNQAEPASQP